MIKGLRLKFICVNMLIVTLVLCLMFGMTIHMTHASMEEEGLELLRTSVYPEKDKGNSEEGGKKDKQPKGEGKTVTDTTDASSDSGKDNGDSAKGGPRGDGPDKKGENLRLPTFSLRYDAQGNLIAKGSDFYDLSDPEYLQELVDTAKATGEEHGTLKAYGLRFLYTEQTGSPVYVFADISSETATMNHLVVDVLLVGLTAFLTFLLLSIFLSRWAIKPVEKAWSQQQQFIADASHELKTPLTVILTNAELMWDNELAPAQQRQCVGNVLDMSRRMRTLTEEMLTLARAENIQQEIMEEQCRLDLILEDASLSFEALLFEQGLELETELAPDVCIKGNETQLRQLAEILLDNARKYALPGVVELKLEKNGMRTCTLSLSNPAEPVSEEELEHLFERFYRIDKARNSDGSFGLGLSIAEGIVNRHKGNITATYHSDRMIFTVQFPTAG